MRLRLFDYLPDSFALGFALGALVFAYWDNIAAGFRKHVLRRPPPPPEPREIEAWLGGICPHFDPKREHEAHLLFTVFNGGEVPFRLAAIEGQMALSHDDGMGRRTTTTLAPPYLDPRENRDRLIKPGSKTIYTIIQPLPKSVVKLMPDLFGWSTRPNLRFDELKVRLSSPDAPDAYLQLWESMRLTTGEWEVRGVETFRLFKSDEQAKKVRESLVTLANNVG